MGKQVGGQVGTRGRKGDERWVSGQGRWVSGNERWVGEAMRGGWSR